ncbi:tRNA glutamyl-Q(34) synthetase GluQRS [Rhodobacteraceae bacterium WD3A24]|nr:tRNA glutamyl-Q(34) synthetase GluQRS [Rhodobacteraceae bacterium WD3A24]
MQGAVASAGANATRLTRTGPRPRFPNGLQGRSKVPPEAYRTRFAPSPTGYLHLGHAYSALTAAHRAAERGGTMLLRIEDIDTARCKPEFEAAIFEDLAWLGLRWEEPVMRQSARRTAYDSALERLVAMGLCYPCCCTRREIRAALSAHQEGADRPPTYPGTCRQRPMAEAGPDDAIRLDMGRALAAAGTSLHFTETGPARPGEHVVSAAQLAEEHGDIILARRDIGTSYHLAVVVDDAAQAITEIVRGGDLFDSTPVHRLLQVLLGLPRPTYYHHRLIRDDSGRRLAKRDDARAIRRYRADGEAPARLRAGLGFA